MIRQLRALLVSIFFLSLCSFSFAQSAAIQGSVSDATGAVIPKVLVRAVDQRTGTERHVQTNGSGQYSVQGLDPSLYKIFVQATGFSTAASTPITLNVGQNAVLDFKLQVGQGSEVVTVDADDLSINTTDASVSTVIDRKFVENIPLNGRSFQDLIAMTPGVVTQSPQSNSALGSNGDFSVNGQRTESNIYTVDGVAANANPGNGGGFPGAGAAGTLPSATALGTTQSMISVDALQEFRIQSSTYSAEYGRSPGGQISLVTRSGTDKLHGTVFDYIRNNAFDANDWFNNHYGVPATPLRQNDFGGTLGGPIWLPHLYDGRKSAFFFVSYEGLRLDQPQAATIQYVPDATLRQAAAPALQPILNAFPLPTPNGIDYPGGLAQFIEPYSLPSQINSTSVRIDKIIAQKWALFFRFGGTPSQSETRTLSSVTNSQNNNWTYTLGLNTQVSSSMNNEFRLNYTRTDAKQVMYLDGFGGAQPTDLNAAMGAGGNANASSSMTLDLESVGGSGIYQSNSYNKARNWNITDKWNISLGHHQIKAGIDYLRIASPLLSYTPQVAPYYLDSDSLIPSIKSNQALEVDIINTLPATPITNETSIFVQDEWRIKPTLSLSLGMRWEIDPPPTGANGRDPYTVLGKIEDPSSLTLAPSGTPLWKTTWYNLAPRLGAAWQVNSTPHHETVLRAGGGVFFDSDNAVATGGFYGLGFQASETYVNAPLPVSPSQLNFTPSALPPYTEAPIYAFPSHLQLPYTLQWNVSIQQALSKQDAITLSYVASNGRRLTASQQTYITSLNPQFGVIDYYIANLTSNYQSLQLSYQRTVGHGIHVFGAYTWAHALDYGSTSTANPVQRGNSDYDVRQTFQTGLTWDIPYLKGNGIGHALVKDWALDARVQARSSFPVPLLGNSLLNPADGTRYYGGINYDPSKPLYRYGPQYPGGKAINGGPAVQPADAAITLPEGSNIGNAPRNFVRGFGAQQFNMALRRDIHIYEKASLQFRAEAFNTFNHPNYGKIDSYLYDLTFGQATNMLNSSLGTVAAQYQQGGARSMQFALKLQF